MAIRNKAMELLAADTGSLAPAANPIQMVLVMNDFPSAESTTFADLVVATFDGSAAIDVELNAQPEGFDPVDNASIIDLAPPVGGFRWETTGTTNLPQTIFGYALLNNAGNLLLASGLLASPITLTAINQRIDIGDANLRLAADSIS